MSKRFLLQNTAIAAVIALTATVLAASPVLSQEDDSLVCDGLEATIVGTAGDDVLQGTWQDDVIVGLGGNDVIRGGSGSDTICGGDGNDEIHGESQGDIIVAQLQEQPLVPIALGDPA